MELEDLIRLHEQHGTVFSTVVSGQDDLSTADGRMVARIKASVDAAEVERQSERIRRAHLQRAARGTTNHGGRPFGWADDKLALHPGEAPLVQKAARDLLDGVPLRRVAAAWNAAGVKTSRGGEWQHTELRHVFCSARGWSACAPPGSHRRRRTGRVGAAARPPDVGRSAGDVPA